MGGYLIFDPYVRQVDAWRSYLQAARSPERLKAFVGQLTGLGQKLEQGFEFVSGASDEDRVRVLFCEQVLDERQLVAEMEAAIQAYEQYLFEQDRKILEVAGVSREAWARKVKAAAPAPTDWKRSMEPVVARAVSEARQDAARFVATTVAADLTGDGIKKIARKAGWDTSEEGSLTDWLTGLAVDLGASLAIDALTDPTDDIADRLSQEMARVEYSLLDGEQGLFAVLQRMKSAHQKARNSLVGPVHGR